MLSDAMTRNRAKQDDRKPLRRAGAIGALSTVIALGLAGVSADPVRAGTYVMRNCDVPGQPSALMRPWRRFNDNVPGVVLADACASGGGLGLTLENGQLSGSIGFALDKPTGARSQIAFVKILLWYAARLAGSGPPMNLWAGQRLPAGQYGVTLINGAPGSEYLVAEQQLRADATSYELGIQCGPINGVPPTEPCIPADRMPLLIRGMEVTLSEETPPIVGAPTGNLLDGGAQSGIRGLTYSASDSQSGLSKIDVLLDETVVASRDLTAQCSYSDFTVCPETQSETLPIDTRAVANGRHRLRVRVHDAAGNERQIYSDGAVVVANTLGLGSMLQGHEVSAAFKGASKATLTVPYGGRVVVRGRLTHGAQPVPAGTPIDVLERLDRPAAREVPAARTTTKADGSYTVVLATRRPSRTVRVAYRPVGAGQVVSRSLRLRVRAASRLRASLRGRVIRFSGSVLSTPVPRGGKRILMEGAAAGSAWTVFRILRTDSKGRFEGAYLLRVRRPGVVLKVRAAVPRERGYGYLTSRSKYVSLRVR